MRNHGWLLPFLMTALVLVVSEAQAAMLTFPGVTLTVPDGRSADPGELVTYCYTLTNHTSIARTFNVDFKSSAGWPVVGEIGEILLGPGEEAMIALSVIVPADALAGAEDRLELLLTWNAGFDTAKATAITKVNVRQDFNLSGPAPVTAPAGSVITMPIAVDNMGNVPDIYEFEASSDSNWPLSPRTGTIGVPPVASRIIECTLTIPARANRGDVDVVIVTVRAKSTGRVQKTSILVKVGDPPVDGHIIVGEERYLLSGEIGISGAYPINAGYPQGWLRLSGPVGPDEWLELFLTATDYPGGLGLGNSFLFYRARDYQLKVGAFAAPPGGMIDPGTTTAGLAGLYRLDVGQVEFVVGTPSSSAPSLDPLWYALGWSGRWTWGDAAIRLLQTDTGNNASNTPYIEGSFGWHDDDQNLSAGLVLGGNNAAGASLRYDQRFGRFGLRGGLSWMEQLNGDDSRYSLNLGGTYRWYANRNLGLDLGLTHADPMGAASAYETWNARLTLALRQDLSLYASTMATRREDMGWGLSLAEYIVGLGYALTDLGNPFKAALELSSTEAPPSTSDYHLRFMGEYRFLPRDNGGEWLAQAQASLHQDEGTGTLEFHSGDLSVTYKDDPSGDDFYYRVGLALCFPDTAVKANGEFNWDITPDTYLAGQCILWDTIQLKLKFVHRFDLGVPRPRATITGVVFQDLNLNGFPDPGEPGVPGAGILLDGEKLGTAGIGGLWTLEGVDPGQHTVAVDCSFDPSLHPVDGPKPVATKSGDRAAVPIPVVRLSLLTGHVYVDQDGDGRFTSGDRPLPSLPVVLTKPDGGQETSETGSDGAYLFTELSPGVYQVAPLPSTGLPPDVSLPGPLAVTAAQESALNVDLPAMEKEKPVMITFIASPAISASANPTVVVQGGEITLDVRSDMPISRVVAEIERGVLIDVPTDDDKWSGRIKIPVGQPIGPLPITISAWDGGGGPGTAMVTVTVIKPLLSPSLVATATPAKVPAGTLVTLNVKADMALSRLEIALPGGQPLVYKADGPEWTGTLRIPESQGPGPLTIAIKGWNGGPDPGVTQVTITVTELKSPTLTATAMPSTVFAGETVTLDVLADMILSRVEVALPKGTPIAARANADKWSGTVRIPADQLPGPLTIKIKGWNGSPDPGATEVTVNVLKPTAPKLSAVAEPAAVYPGDTVTLNVTADMKLSRLEIALPAGQPIIVKAGDVKWSGPVMIPFGQPPGPLTIAIKGWNGAPEPGETLAVVMVKAKPALPDPLRIYFDVGSARIKEQYYGVLKQVAETLKADPKAKLMLVGHADSTGSKDVNDKLSLERARSVKQYLVERFNIDPKRIEIAGLGKDQPIADNATPEGRARNRRAEFIWIEIFG